MSRHLIDVAVNVRNELLMKKATDNVDSSQADNIEDRQALPAKDCTFPAHNNNTSPYYVLVALCHRHSALQCLQCWLYHFRPESQQARVSEPHSSAGCAINLGQICHGETQSLCGLPLRALYDYACGAAGLKAAAVHDVGHGGVPYMNAPEDKQLCLLRAPQLSGSGNVRQRKGHVRSGEALHSAHCVRLQSQL